MPRVFYVKEQSNAIRNVSLNAAMRFALSSLYLSSTGSISLRRTQSTRVKNTKEGRKRVYKKTPI